MSLTILLFGFGFRLVSSANGLPPLNWGLIESDSSPSFLIPSEPKAVVKEKEFDKPLRKEREDSSDKRDFKPKAKDRGARRGYGRRKDAIRIAKKS